MKSNAKEIKPRPALVNASLYLGENEVYTEFVKCPKCGKSIFANSKFCSDCGVAIVLCQTIRDWIKSNR